MRVLEIGLLGLGIFAIVAVGYLNLHTDEMMVVLPFVVLVSGCFGLGQPRLAWLWAFLVGGAVPASQLVALLLNWHVPYPNDIVAIETACIALGPAFLGAFVGAGFRRLIGEVGRPRAAE